MSAKKKAAKKKVAKKAAKKKAAPGIAKKPRKRNVSVIGDVEHDQAWQRGEGVECVPEG